MVVEVFPLQTLLMLVVQVVHDSERQPEPLAAVAVQALQALRLLLAVCSGKVEAAAVVVPLALGVLAVLAVVALVVAAVELVALHMPLAPVV